MKNLNITVANKIATYCQRDGVIVCGNSDYQITFAFDSEWSSHTDKIARFKWNGDFKDVPFEGTVVTVPKIKNTTEVSVGVYAGDLSTTTPAEIPCVKSILCGDEVELITEEDKGSIDGRINTLEALGQTLKNQIAKKKLFHNKVKIDFYYTHPSSTYILSSYPSGSIYLNYLGTANTLEGSFPSFTNVYQRLGRAVYQSVGFDRRYGWSEVSLNGSTYPVRAINIYLNGETLAYINIVTESWEDNTYKTTRLNCYADYYRKIESTGDSELFSGVSLKLTIQDAGSYNIFT